MPLFPCLLNCLLIHLTSGLGRQWQHISRSLHYVRPSPKLGFRAGQAASGLQFVLPVIII